MSSLLFSLLNNPDFEEGKLWLRVSQPANATIFTEGDHSSEVYLVLAGELRVFGKVDLDDQRKIQPGFVELTKGDIFGEMVMFDDSPRSATVVCITDVELAVIKADDLFSFLDSHPDCGYPIMKELLSVVVQRLRKANQRIFSLFAWGLKSKGLDNHL